MTAPTAASTPPNTPRIAREDISNGDIVTVFGYGGFAEVLHIEQDGVGPHGHPKYLVTIKWGPNNPQAGSAKRGIGIETYPLGRLRPAVEQTAAKRLDDIDDMDEEQLLRRLAQLKANLSK